MGIKVPLPKGQWAELVDPEEITGSQKRQYQQAVDVMMYGTGDVRMKEVPDPDNPAVMLLVAPPRARLNAGNIADLRDMVHGWCIKDWSYDLPLPYTAASLDGLPAVAHEAIEDALTKHGHYSVYNGTGPKETTETGSTSSSTSPGADLTLPPE